jgi:WD40 repeat protein
LILLAANQSAESKWVDDEIDYWAANKSIDKVVVALTGGEIAVDAEAQRIDWDKSTALSERFRAAVGEDAVPLYEDLRPFKVNTDHANLRNPHFRDEVAKIVGRIEEEDPGELASEDKRQYQHGVRLKRIAEIGLVILTMTAAILGVLAILSAREAIENEQQAISGAIAAQGIAISPEVPDFGALLALESMRIRPTVDAYISVINSIVTPTNFRWRAGMDGKPIVGAAASSSDGRLVVMGNDSGEVWLMTPDEPKELATLKVSGSVISVAFTKDNSTVKILDGAGFLTSWDVNTRSFTNIRLGELVAGTISGDGTTVALAEPDAATIKIFDQGEAGVTTLELPLPLSVDCLDGIGCLTLSDDGGSLAWVEYDAPYDVVVIRSSGETEEVLFETPQIVTAMAFTPEGKEIVVAEDGGRAHLLPAADDSTVLLDNDADLIADADFYDFAFATSPDGVAFPLATAHRNGSVKLWELYPEFGFGDLVGELTRHDDEVRSVTYLLDGSSVVSGAWDGDIISWWADAIAKNGTITADPHADAIVDVTFIGNQPRLASLSEDGTVSFWNVAQSGELTNDGGFPVAGRDPVFALSMDVAPDGDVIAVGVDASIADTASLLLFGASGEPRGSLATPYGAAVSVTFSNDGNWLAAAFSAGQVVVWDTADFGGPPKQEFNTGGNSFGDVDFSGDSRLLAGSGADGITVWDIGDGSTVLTVPGNLGANVTAVSLNSNGTVLAWGDDTRLIGLWNIIEDARIGQSLSGHNEEITDLEFVQFGEEDVLLASTSQDAETRIWSVDAGRLVARIQAHSNDVTAVDVTIPHGLMVTSGRDHALWVASLDPDSWIDAACALAGRNMTQAEWEAVQGDAPYVRHCNYPSGEGALADASLWSFKFTGVITSTE